MKTKRFLSLVAISIALSFTFFACSGESDPSGPNDSGGGISSSAEQQETQVLCQLAAGTCSQISLSSCMELVNAGAAQIVSSCQVPSSSSVYVPPPSSSSVYAPPPSSSSARPSSSSAALPPNALEITLNAYKELKPLDPTGYGDPRISFRVRTYSEGVSLNDITTKLLLDREDINEWNGTARDTVTIHTMVDSVLVNPIVKEADVLSDDDYSPNGVYVTGPFTSGDTYNNITRQNTNADVSITFGFRFIRR